MGNIQNMRGYKECEQYWLALRKRNQDKIDGF